MTGKGLEMLILDGSGSSKRIDGCITLTFDGVSLAGVAVFFVGGPSAVERRPADLRFSGMTILSLLLHSRSSIQHAKTNAVVHLNCSLSWVMYSFEQVVPNLFIAISIMIDGGGW